MCHGLKATTGGGGGGGAEKDILKKNLPFCLRPKTLTLGGGEGWGAAGAGARGGALGGGAQHRAY